MSQLFYQQSCGCSLLAHQLSHYTRELVLVLTCRGPECSVVSQEQPGPVRIACQDCLTPPGSACEVHPLAVPCKNTAGAQPSSLTAECHRLPLLLLTTRSAGSSPAQRDPGWAWRLSLTFLFILHPDCAVNPSRLHGRLTVGSFTFPSS